MRSKVARAVRDVLHDNDFVEVETPMLLQTSPEGAREYLVPARLSSTATSSAPSTSPSSTSTTPQFYALSQSPQQPKQLLVCSGGIEKYYQFARCFRDEDGRKDRQPEFTQIDMEMAFVSWSPPPMSQVEQPSTSSDKYFDDRRWRIGGTEIRNVVESIISQVWKTALGVELPPEFGVMTYRMAMEKYGSDKPDLRMNSVLPYSSTHIQQIELSDSKRVIDYLVVPRQDQELLKDLLSLNESGVKSYTVSSKAGWEKGLAKELGWSGDVKAAKSGIELSEGTLLIGCLRDTYLNGGSTSMGKVRLRLSELAQQKYELDYPKYCFTWVTEFPLFSKDEDKEFMAHGRWSSTHHPFTAPMLEDLPLLEQGQYEKVRGQHYDLVLNGMEIGGGSVRVHNAPLQENIFKEVLQLTESEINSFDHLLKALKYGAPPHGGIALGFDRLMSIICNSKSIRDVIAFPKTAGGTDPVFRSPSAIPDETLKQYGLRSL
ncbi:hypothetical protein FRB90_012826 [Tulasnella sp. 427]|nr:hypothetical protein FRB90_012826 [Tulasnella sp. 427]